jgi:hypothetical protein
VFARRQKDGKTATNLGGIGSAVVAEINGSRSPPLDSFFKIRDFS